MFSALGDMPDNAGRQRGLGRHRVGSDTSTVRAGYAWAVDIVIEGRDHTGGSSFIRTEGDDIELSGATTADQDFIAHARQDIPRLLAEIVRLKISHAQKG